MTKPDARCICPSCHLKRELVWAEWAAEELLEEAPHRQVVFTIPKRRRPYFRYERALLGELAGCAWRALRLWMLAYFEDETAVPGAVGFIQTSGELLNWHPHVHLLITDGVFDRDGTFERFTYFDTHLIEVFRAEVLRLLMGKGLIVPRAPSTPRARWPAGTCTSSSPGCSMSAGMPQRAFAPRHDNDSPRASPKGSDSDRGCGCLAAAGPVPLSSLRGTGEIHKKGFPILR